MTSTLAVLRRIPAIGERDARRGISGGGTPPFIPIIFALDNMVAGSTGALAGRVPDIGAAWVKATTASGVLNISSGTYIDGASSTSGYYVIPTAPSTTDYEVSAFVHETNASDLPSLLVGFTSANPAFGYRVFYDSLNLDIQIQQVNNGTSTNLGLPDPVGTSFGATPHAWRFARFVLSDRVRVRLIDDTSGQVMVIDDASAQKVTAINYGGVNTRQNGRIEPPFSVHDMPTPVLGTVLVPLGTRTWYNSLQVTSIAGKLYMGSVVQAGDINVSKIDAGVTTSFTLHAALEPDDHDDPGMCQLPGGRLFCAYSKHSTDTVGMRYRVSTNPLPDISAFNAEVVVANGGTATAYAQTSLLSDGYVRVLQRSGAGGTRPTQLVKALATDVEAGTATWTRTAIFQNTNQRPYLNAYNSGGNRTDLLVTSGHPNETVTSVYHIYMIAAAGSETWYKSDGTQITATQPFDITAQGTLVQDGSDGGGRCWNWNVQIGPDGYPRVLYTRYPSSTGARDIIFKDIEYWHARWDGTQWVKTRISTGNVSLYPNENSYAGGMCFDRLDVTRLYVAEPVNGIYELSEYSFNEAAQTKSLVRTITKNSMAHNFRPASPEASDRSHKVTWCSGPYASYVKFGTAIYGD